MDPRTYYDRFASRQVQVGVNERHRAILGWLKRFGLAPGMQVLEVGCGVGTQTELIARYFQGSGRVLAVDLSPRSVELARERLAGHANVEFIAGDVMDLDIGGPFDVVVMPDVIEHIPLEQHPRLFAKVRKWVKETGWVLIHIPNPQYLEWCRNHCPELLQIVDQPIHTDRLLASIVPSGLYVHYLSTYSIWVAECDYQVILLRVRRETDFSVLTRPPTLRQRMGTWLLNAFNGGKHQR